MSGRTLTTGTCASGASGSSSPGAGSRDVQTFRIDAPGHPAHGSIHTAPGVPWNPYNIAVAPALLGLTGSPTAPEAVTHRKDVFQCDGWDPIHRIWIYREGERA